MAGASAGTDGGEQGSDDGAVRARGRGPAIERIAVGGLGGGPHSPGRSDLGTARDRQEPDASCDCCGRSVPGTPVRSALRLLIASGTYAAVDNVLFGTDRLLEALLP